MEISCPIDAQFANEISALLNPPSPPQVEEYFERLLTARQCRGIKVKQDGDFGKGVHAEVDFKEGDLVLKDQMLVGDQHSLNKIDCLVCSFCFSFIGSLEYQIGRRLYLQEIGASTNHGCDIEASSDISNDCYETDSSDGEGTSHVKSHDHSNGCCSSSSKETIPLPDGIVESLMNGGLELPYSKDFSMPPPVPCSGGCEAYYCSDLCAQADWEQFHSLLCTGERSESTRREALIKFIQHANETNDIFLVAAKAISCTILKYRKLKATRVREQKNCDTHNISDGTDLFTLLEAWKPFSMGYKRRWWECIALPDEVDYSDESQFRMQIKELAYTSLQLLKAAIFDKECEAFEDYFLYIDDLPHPEKKKVEGITRPFLDALGDDYSVCCQGTAFFPLQSCMNHSCCPNAKAFKREEDKDGQASIIALRPISKGEEVTISYIDEDIPFEERQALLADYGFKCSCPKCFEERPK